MLHNDISQNSTNIREKNDVLYIAKISCSEVATDKSHYKGGLEDCWRELGPFFHCT